MQHEVQFAVRAGHPARARRNGSPVGKSLESWVRRVFAGVASAGTFDADFPGVEGAGAEDSAVHALQQRQALAFCSGEPDPCEVKATSMLSVAKS